MEQKAKILDKKESSHQDSLENLIAQLGTEQDKRHHSRFVNAKRLSAKGNETELNAMYRTDWLAGKAVDIIPNDMTREWRDFDGDIDPDIVKQLEEEEKRLDLSGSFNMAHKWARLYGNGFVVMSIDDGQDPSEPLDIDTIKPGSLRHIKVVDRHRVSREGIEPTQDPLDENFGMPERYRFNQTAVVIHHTRILRFDGVLLPFDEFKRNNYFSDSVLDRLYEALTDFNTVTSSSASMVYETNVDIIKVDGMMNLLQTAEGTSRLRKRFTLAGMLKSFNNMLLLDVKETYENKSNTFAGLPDLIDRFSQILASATDIPATRLLGSSASGLNATGEGDLKNYYDMIRSQQNSVYRALLDRFDLIMAKSLGLSDDLDMSYKFNSLFQMTPKQQAEVDLANAQRDQVYLQNDVVKESTVAKELQQNGTYTNITKEDIAELEAFEEDDKDDSFATDPIENQIIPEEEENEEGEGSQSPEEV